MEKSYTVAEVIELQTQERQVDQRLAVHKNRAEEKRKELSELFNKVGVKDINELANVCGQLNHQMQEYAVRIQNRVNEIGAKCNELDAML